MATRNQLILTLGHEYLTTNIENDEWKYGKAFKSDGNGVITSFITQSAFTSVINS